MLETVKKYCSALSPSGMEDEIRQMIIEDIKDCSCEYSVDSLGNLTVFKKGAKRRNKKVLFSAHMDEVGFMVKHIDEDGYAWFDAVGGIDRRVASGRRVIFSESRVVGVIASKAIHLQTAEERGKCEPLTEMNIDIGCKSREEAEKLISVGDCAVFMPGFEKFGEGLVRSKALDDRFGCAALVEMIKSNLEYDTYFAFCICEEVGCDGAKTVCHRLRPDFAIALEATTAGDIGATPKAKRACALGEGAVISLMDRGTIYDKGLVQYAASKAEENNIKYQYKNVIAGGNEASAYQKAASGARVLAISAPARYIHSASNVLKKEDIEAVAMLAAAINEGSFDNV